MSMQNRTSEIPDAVVVLGVLTTGYGSPSPMDDESAWPKVDGRWAVEPESRGAAREATGFGRTSSPGLCSNMGLAPKPCASPEPIPAGLCSSTRVLMVSPSARSLSSGQTQSLAEMLQGPHTGPGPAVSGA